MAESFFERPILNSPYAYPDRHWELDDDGQPTDNIFPKRRDSKFLTPVPKPQKRRRPADQPGFVFDSGHGLSTEEQEYNPTPIINDIRRQVEDWRNLRNPDQWQVSPATARLLQHWRRQEWPDIRPFFCQIEAVETIIWLSEVAPRRGASVAKFWSHIRAANEQSNPELIRLALKLATGAGKTTVMAMLIAWQTVNAVRHPGSRQFSRAFLVVTPGITIKDRLRVLGSVSVWIVTALTGSRIDLTVPICLAQGKRWSEHAEGSTGTEAPRRRDRQRRQGHADLNWRGSRGNRCRQERRRRVGDAGREGSGSPDDAGRAD